MLTNINDMKPTEQEQKIIDSTLKWKLITLFTVAIFGGFVFAKNMEYRTIIMKDFTRTMGTGYQPSTIRDVVVQGSVSISSSLSLSGGESGTINLQTSPDGVTYTTKQHCTNNNTGSLTVGLNTNNTQDTELSTVVPKGYYYKFVAVGTSTMSSTIPVAEIHF